MEKIEVACECGIVWGEGGEFEVLFGADFIRFRWSEKKIVHPTNFSR